MLKRSLSPLTRSQIQRWASIVKLKFTILHTIWNFCTVKSLQNGIKPMKFVYFYIRFQSYYILIFYSDFLMKLVRKTWYVVSFMRFHIAYIFVNNFSFWITSSNRCWSLRRRGLPVEKKQDLQTALRARHHGLGHVIPGQCVSGNLTRETVSGLVSEKQCVWRSTSLNLLLSETIFRRNYLLHCWKEDANQFMLIGFTCS